MVLTILVTFRGFKNEKTFTYKSKIRPKRYRIRFLGIHEYDNHLKILTCTFCVKYQYVSLIKLGIKKYRSEYRSRKTCMSNIMLNVLMSVLN